MDVNDELLTCDATDVLPSIPVAGSLLEGKVALVTGAARGIGAACALSMAAQGADLILTDIQPEPEALVDKIKNLGRKVIYVPCDVRDENAQIFAVSEISKISETIDILVANAGINGYWGPIDNFPLEKFEELMSTNVRGTFLTLKHSIPFMKEKGGSIVVIASVNGTRTFHHGGSSIYCASKAAISAMAKAVAIELGRFNIRVNTICPGKIRTDIDQTLEMDNKTEHVGLAFKTGSPMLGSGIGNADDVADACLFLASDLSKHLSGTEVFVDGGQSLIA